MGLRLRVAIVLCLAIALFVTGCGASGGQGSSGGSAAGGQALMETKCTMCHSLDRVNGAVYDAAQWEATVSRMEANGLVVTAEEKAAIVSYLAERDAAR